MPCHIRKRGLLKGAKAVESLREAAFLRAAFKLAFQQRFHIGYGQHLLEQADYEQISELDASITFLYRRGHNTELYIIIDHAGCQCMTTVFRQKRPQIFVQQRQDLIEVQVYIRQFVPTRQTLCGQPGTPGGDTIVYFHDDAALLLIGLILWQKYAGKLQIQYITVLAKEQ